GRSLFKMTSQTHEQGDCIGTVEFVLTIRDSIDMDEESMINQLARRVYKGNESFECFDQSLIEVSLRVLKDTECGWVVRINASYVMLNLMFKRKDLIHSFIEKGALEVIAKCIVTAHEK
ncbi:hypothetical protein PENTCL1PPCAC_7858, partial [Pristionchus entomophagus]